MSEFPAATMPPVGSQRLFLALELPEPVRETLARLADPALPGVRWVETAKLHLTLSFLGDVDVERRTRLRETLAAVRVPPFWLPVSGLGSFGGARPSVLWVGVGNAHPHLFALYKKVQDAALAAGLEPDLRPFKPHVTLARCERRVSPGAVRQWLKTHGEFEAGMFPVNGFTLFSSRLSLTGSTYARELEVAF